MDESFSQSLLRCGADLEAAALRYFQEELRRELRREPAANDQATFLRDEAAAALPCLRAVMPKGAYAEDALENIDPEGLLDAVGRLAGNYINYDAARAHDDFTAVLAQLREDLKSAGGAEARRNLLELLVSRGMVDQLLRSLILSDVRQAIADLPNEDQLPADVVAALVRPEVLEAAVSGEKITEFRPLLVKEILGPVLLEGASLKDPGPAAAKILLREKIGQALLDSEAFGDALTRHVVQTQIDAKTSVLSRFFGRTFLGYSSFDWDTARQTEAGQKAEAYLREMVLRPKFLGETLSPEETQRRRDEASRLIQESLKKP
jgi:hypothetical protein